MCCGMTGVMRGLLVRITPHHSSLYHTNCRQHPVVLIRHCVDIMLVFASDWARLWYWWWWWWWWCCVPGAARYQGWGRISCAALPPLKHKDWGLRGAVWLTGSLWTVNSQTQNTTATTRLSWNTAIQTWRREASHQLFSELRRTEDSGTPWWRVKPSPRLYIDSRGGDPTPPPHLTSPHPPSCQASAVFKEPSGVKELKIRQWKVEPLPCRPVWGDIVRSELVRGGPWWWGCSTWPSPVVPTCCTPPPPCQAALVRLEVRPSSPPPSTQHGIIRVSFPLSQQGSELWVKTNTASSVQFLHLKSQNWRFSHVRSRKLLYKKIHSCKVRRFCASTVF